MEYYSERWEWVKGKIISLCMVILLSCMCLVEVAKSDGAIVAPGKKVSTERPFKRIISLYGAHTENLFSLGLDKEIVGVSVNENHPPCVLTKSVFSYHDDAEKFIAARPDLVLIRPMIARP